MINESDNDEDKDEQVYRPVTHQNTHDIPHELSLPASDNMMHVPSESTGSGDAECDISTPLCEADHIPDQINGNSNAVLADSTSDEDDITPRRSTRSRQLPTELQDYMLLY